MQSVGGSDKNLECGDCKTCFTSASLLLKHFAEHIIDQASETELNFYNECANATSSKKSKLSLLQAKKKERKESILETVLRQSALQNRANGKMLQLNSLHNDIAFYSNTSSSDSFSTSNQNFPNRNFDVSDFEKVEEIALPNEMVIEIGQRAKEKNKFSSDMTLVKFDLQKRLENCVTRLALKQGHKEFESPKSTTMSNKQRKTIPVENNVTKSVDKEVTKKCDGEDFNPMKYCVVTLESSVDKEGTGIVQNVTKEQCSSKPLKGSSNRKQLMPKKIHRPKEESAGVEVLKTDILSLSDNRVSPKPSSTKRKYLCHVCSKSFGWSTDLKRHILTHTGERPFKCQMCEATFTRNFLLQKHESRVHSLDNIDSNNRFTQEDRGDPLKSTNNKEVSSVHAEKQALLSGKSQTNKVWRNRRLLNNNIKGPLALNLEKTDETCDKFIPAKRKLQSEELSYEHFPQKVFNIL